MRIILFISLFFFSIFNFDYLLAKESKIVVKIENKIITNFEIKNKILSSLILANLEINQKNINQFKNQALEFLINIKLKEIELAKYNINVDDNRLTAYLNSISSNNIPALKNRFLNLDLDFNLFSKNIMTELKWKSFIFGKYSKKIEIDEKSVMKELEQVKKDNSTIKEYNLSEIELNLRNNQIENDSITFIFKKISEIGFEETAIQYSTSSTSSIKGNLGWINSKSLSDNIKKQIIKMEPGEISDPIKMTNNVLILKLNDTRTISNKEIDLDKLKSNIINKKKNDLFDLYSSSYLSKLKNSSLIEYR